MDATTFETLRPQRCTLVATVPKAIVTPSIKARS